MEKNELKNANIKISSIEDKGTYLRVVDNVMTRFTLFKMKKDGSQTKAYESFNDLKLRIGDEIAIGYKEDSYIDSRGISRTSNQIVLFKPIDGIPSKLTNSSKSVKTIKSMEQPELKVIPDKQLNWEQLGFEKTCSLWIASLIQHSGKVQDEYDFDKFYSLFNKIKEAGAYHFNPDSLNFPTIQDDEVDIANVPF